MRQTVIEALEVALDWSRDLLGATAVLTVVTMIFIGVLVAEVFALAYLAVTTPRGRNG